MSRKKSQDRYEARLIGMALLIGIPLMLVVKYPFIGVLVAFFIVTHIIVKVSEKISSKKKSSASHSPGMTWSQKRKAGREARSVTEASRRIDEICEVATEWKRKIDMGEVPSPQQQPAHITPSKSAGHPSPSPRQASKQVSAAIANSKFMPSPQSEKKFEPEQPMPESDSQPTSHERMAWEDYLTACDSWDEDAIIRNFPSEDVLKTASAKEVADLFCYYMCSNDGWFVPLKRVIRSGIIFTKEQAIEMINVGSKEVSNTLFLLYISQMRYDDLIEIDGTVDGEIWQKGLMIWISDTESISWKEYYSMCTGYADIPEEIRIALSVKLTAFGKADEVCEVAEEICDKDYCSIFVDRAIAAGVKFNFEQTCELTYGVVRETANRLCLAYGKKLTADQAYEIEDNVDDYIIESLRYGDAASREEGRKMGMKGSIAAVAVGAAVANRLLGHRGNEEGGGAMGGGIGVQKPDVFGSDYMGIFNSEETRDEYYRRVRQERYESGEFSDEFGNE